MSRFISLMFFQVALITALTLLWIEETADADHPIMETDFTGLYVRLILLMVAGIGIGFFAQVSKREGRENLPE